MDNDLKPAVAADVAATASTARKTAKKARKKADDAKVKMEESKKQADDAEEAEAEDAEETRKAAEDAEEEYKMLSEEADDAESEAKKAEDMEEEEEEDEEKKDKDKEARRASRISGQRAQKADTQRIASLCRLAGYENLFAQFVSEDLSVAQVEKKLHDLRAEKSSAARVDSNFGIVTSNSMDTMDQQARSLSRSAGISLAKAYQRLLADNPGLYQDYLDEREQNMLTSKSKREYIGQLAARFAAQGRGTQTAVSQDRLPVGGQKGFSKLGFTVLLAIALLIGAAIVGVGLPKVILALAFIGVMTGMAWEAIQQNFSANAKVDLTGKQFYAVTVDNTGQLIVANQNKQCSGILQDKPNVGQAGNVCRDGITKAAISANQVIGIGELLEVDSGGTLAAWATANPAVARAMEAGTSTGVFLLTVELMRPDTGKY
jgi:hypothetical protein